MKRIAVLLALALATLATPVMADVNILTGVQGVMITPGTSSPGTAFSLDYRSNMTSTTAPYNLVEVNLTFQTNVSYSDVALTLGSDSTVYRFPQNVTGQTAYTLYDSAVMPAPTGNASYSLLPAAWKTDAADGIISGHFWLEGAGGSPSYGFLGMNSLFAVATTPEPASLLLFTLGIGALFLRKPRTLR